MRFCIIVVYVISFVPLFLLSIYSIFEVKFCRVPVQNLLYYSCAILCESFAGCWRVSFGHPTADFMLFAVATDKSDFMIRAILLPLDSFCEGFVDYVSEKRMYYPNSSFYLFFSFLLDRRMNLSFYIYFWEVFRFYSWSKLGVRFVFDAEP